MKSKDLIEDPRTIYSLAMVLILYEVYKSDLLSDLFKGEEELFFVIKISLLILIIAQLIFLLLTGISLAEYKDENIENLWKTADFFYTIGFQSVVVLFLLVSGSILTYSILKQYIINQVIPEPWNLILSIIISLLIALWVISIRKKYFKIREETNQIIYFIIFIWIIVNTGLLVSTHFFD